jgi:nucleotide-binding universal stress UspA family protein
VQELLQKVATSQNESRCTTLRVPLGAVFDAAASKARYYDLTVLPWSAHAGAASDMAEAIVFGSGRPAVLVPPAGQFSSLDRIAIAWDGSRVAARALADALPLLAEGGEIFVLTIEDEKPLEGTNLAGALASSLERQGHLCRAGEDQLWARAEFRTPCRKTALSKGCQLLAMGGFGHSRIRDFVLGGATKGVLAESPASSPALALVPRDQSNSRMNVSPRRGLGG